MSELKDYLQFVRPWGDNSLKVVTTEWLPPGEPAKKKMIRGAESLDDVAGLIQFYDRKGENTWFSTQTFQRNPAAVHADRYGKWFKQVHRKQQFVSAMHCFYADLDVKPDAYSSLEDAATAIYQACVKHGVPEPSMMVCSGYGLHIYWRIDEDMTIQQWQPVANALRNMMVQEGIHADHGCTIDSARILRPPGVRNWKDPQNPKPTYIFYASRQVYTLAQMAAPLRHFMGPVLATVQGKVVGPVAQGATGLNRNLMAGVDESLPVDLHEVATECPMLEEQFQLRGAGASQPLWSLVAMACAFDKTPWDTFQELSDGYAGYDAALAAQKLAEKINVKGRTGWPSCNAFASESSHCATCPHLAAGKSPLHLKAKPKAAPGVLPGAAPDLPPLYYQMPDGTIWTQMFDPKTNARVNVCAMNYAISDGALDQDTGDLIFTAVLGGKPETIRVKKQGRWRAADLRDVLCNQHVLSPETEAKKVGDFIVAWVTHLRAKGASIRSSQLGWGPNHSFTHGETIWINGRGEKAIYRDESVTRHFYVRGDIKTWQTLVNLILAEKRAAAEVILASSFAAPLVELCGQQSVMLAIRSQSGTGKSTAIAAAAGVWGNPVSSVQMLTDTGASKFITMGTTRSLPMFWDEAGSQGKDIHERNLQQLIETVFRLGHGRDKARATANLQLRETVTFRTMMVLASNRSIVEKVTQATADTDAGAARVFEMRMPPLGSALLDPRYLKLQTALEENCGHAGAEYARWLSANHANVKAAFERVQAWVLAEFKLTPVERFWATVISTCILGAQCAAKAGIVTLDIAGMVDFLKGELAEMRSFRREYVQSPTTPEALGQLIGELIRDQRIVLHTDNIVIGAGRVATAVKTPVSIADYDRNNYWAQYASVMGILRVVKHSFRQWCHARNMSGKEVCEALVARGATEGRAGIGTGIGASFMDRNPTRSRTLDIPLASIMGHLP